MTFEELESKLRQANLELKARVAESSAADQALKEATEKLNVLQNLFDEKYADVRAHAEYPSRWWKTR